MSGSILQRIVQVGLLALFALLQASPAAAGAPRRFIVFGDSLSDPGNAFVLLRDVEVPPFKFENLIPDAPYARGALHFSNGATWVEQLSVLDHALPSTGPALFSPVLFSNYAVGGARARPGGFFDLSTQVRLFLNDFDNRAPADALYIVFIGGNDVRDALFAPVQSAAIIQNALLAIQNNLSTLHAAGASNFLVVNAPNLGLAPAVRLFGQGAQAAASGLAFQFNRGLDQILGGLESGPGLNIVLLDVFELLNQIVAHPGAFGLTEVERPCIAVDTTVQPFCANPGTFLFWDGIHPTTAGHRILAERARAVLP